MIGRGPGHPRHDAAARGQPSDESASQASRGSVAALTIAALGIEHGELEIETDEGQRVAREAQPCRAV
jgi:hypothetical protein